MTRFLGLSLVAVSCIFFGVLFASSSASAASVYDNAYKTTPNLRFSDNSYGVDEDVSKNWSQLILDDNGIGNGIPLSSVVFTGSSIKLTEQEKQNMRDSFLAAINNGGNWAVSNVCSTDRCEINVWWNSNGGMGLAWYQTSVEATNAEYRVGIKPTLGGNNSKRYYMEVSWIQKTPHTGGALSYPGRYDGRDVYNFLAFVDNKNYPTDYEGEGVRESAGAETVRPRFTYEVQNLSGSATHQPRSAALPTYPNDKYSVEWFVRKCLDWNDTTNICNEYAPENIHYEITESGGTANLTFPDYGYYRISAGYLVGGCERFPSWPATPDYCYYYAPENTDDYEYTLTSMVWHVDGSNFGGDTDDEDLVCDVSGFCEPPPFNCADVYADNFIQRLGCTMQQNMDFGLINPALFAIRDLINSLTVPSPSTCSLVLTNVHIAPGRSFPLGDYPQEICIRTAEFRTAFPIATIFLNFSLAFLSLWMIVRIINKLTNPDDHNIVEGV